MSFQRGTQDQAGPDVIVGSLGCPLPSFGTRDRRFVSLLMLPKVLADSLQDCNRSLALSGISTGVPVGSLFRGDGDFRTTRDFAELQESLSRHQRHRHGLGASPRLTRRAAMSSSCGLEDPTWPTTGQIDAIIWLITAGQYYMCRSHSRWKRILCDLACTNLQQLMFPQDSAILSHR